MSRSFSAWGRLTISPRLATAARSAAAFGFGWHGGGGCSARTVFRVNATMLSIANSEAHRVMLAGLVLIFFIGSYALVRFIFSPLVIEVSFELKFFPAEDSSWRKVLLTARVVGLFVVVGFVILFKSVLPMNGS